MIPAATTVIGPGTVTAHSSQVVARNYNRVYVPGYIPATYPPITTPIPVPGYPSYPTYVPYPSIYRFGFSHGYYPYSYGSTVW